MSRIGKQIINVPSGVTVDFSNSQVVVKGPLGQQEFKLFTGLNLKIEEKTLEVAKDNPDQFSKELNALHGLARSLISNMVVGVSSGFEKELEIVGVGYRATAQNKNVQLQLGFSHNVIFTPPEGITVEVLEPTKLKVKGIDKQQVGQVAANIRKIRPPEPFKGKGIRYKDENVRRKAGKTGK